MDEAAKKKLPHNYDELLKPLLSSDGPLLMALGQIKRRAQEIAWGLQVADLTSEQGRAEALKNQGVINGLIMAIDVVLEPEPKEGEEAGENSLAT